MAQLDRATGEQVVAPPGTEPIPQRRPLRRRRRLVGAAITVVVLAALTLYWWMHRPQAPQFQTAEVTRGSVTRAVTASGTVNPMTTVQVGTYVSGVIQSLYCDFNTQVKAGQLCAKIDPRPYQTVVDQETAALATARAQLAKDQANLAFAKVIYDRDVDLLTRKIVSQETVDAASNAWDQAQAQVELDQSTIAQRIATLNAAKVNLDYTNIISPVNGTVVARNVTQGQTVAASFQTPTLFLIATDLAQMQVDTNVAESDIGNVSIGNRVLFTVEAYPDRTFDGTVTQVRQAPQSVQNVITYDAVVGVPNPDLLLKPGMTAAVRIVHAQVDDVLTVPNQALRFSPKRAAKMAGGARGAVASGASDAAPFGAARPSRNDSQQAESSAPSEPAAQSHRPAGHRPGQTTHAVWRLKDGRPERVPVEVGLEDDTNTEIKSGALAEGDTVIVGMHATEEGAGRSPANAPRMPRY